MSARRIPSSTDAVRPRASGPLSITLDGESFDGVDGQTLAGVLLGCGRMSWRATSSGARPRGVFCGIGVCFDCIAEVNGERDVRLCQRRASNGDELRTQRDLPPVPVEDPDTADHADPAGRADGATS
ncbi:2Fe-2S iron-sulfur cluster protein [Labedella gwakjiensis]|uniref:(2Fe-2S)-binding protein n=1 Tax=Labedella gwakjiensis TaxID=390269 RepID=A0A2P8GWL3_9MICO|nr:(2Fe-2S)-binding protein [Labedella gwakjiensis]PSL38356.1 2Fe-2S iron-sulfur cluster protein [Labedella gwakjiensis]RUQ87113.1 (2Fe-2S)-binding protein [Labedella gwakjiensis]